MAGQAGMVHRGNVVPPGGVTPNLVGGVAAGGMIMPDTIQLQELSDLFMENSEFNFLEMPPVTLMGGQTAQFNLQTVGLGEGLELLVEGTISVRNAGVAAETVTLPPDFPYSILRNVSVIFNGQATIVQASGYDLLTLMVKRHLRSRFARSTHAPAGLDARIASVSVTGGTLVSAPAGNPGLTGWSGVTIAAGATAVVTVRFYLDIPFVLRKDLLLGLLPMANTSIHGNVELQVAPFVGANQEFPVMGTANISVTASDLRVRPAYRFWGLPRRRELYQQFVNTSYVVTRFANRPIVSIGGNAIAFEVPINFWLLSALMTLRDSARVLAPVIDRIDNPHLVYNGTIVVDRTSRFLKIARDFIHYGLELPVGHLIYDYTHTGNLDSNSANMSRWLNMYQASNPVLYADILAGFTTPGTFDITLERLAPNHVQVI